MKIIFLISLLVCIRNISGDFFTCTHYMEESEKTAVKVLKILENNIKIEESKLQALKRIAANIRSNLMTSTNSTSKTPPNPVSMYLFAKAMKDASEDITEFSKLIENNTINYLEALGPAFNEHLPGKTDVDGVVNAFARLQNTYSVTAAEMASGSVFGFEVPVLTAFDCFDIGAFMYDLKQPRLAIEWLETAQSKALEGSNGTDISNLLDDLKRSLTEAKNQYRSEKLRDRIAIGSYEVVDPALLTNEKIDEQNNLLEVRQMMRKNTMKFYGEELIRNTKAFQGYEASCMKRETRFGGYCKYSTFNEILFYGRPIKLEFINKSPRILIIHDLFGEKFRIKLLSFKDELVRSGVFIVDTTKGENTTRQTSNVRTSSTYVFKNDSDADGRHVNTLLEKLTGLGMDGERADYFQVVNYGIGGEYKPHYDWIHDYLLPHFYTHTNRILTVLLYLTDVEVGGSTVFPNLNLSIAPSKGSALFFTNLDSEGKGDPMTLHAGCPVFIGSKWIINKWVHAKNQDTNFLKTVPSIWTAA